MNQNVIDSLSLIERLGAPTPKLFKTIRNGGILLGLLGGAILGAEEQGINLPALVPFIGGKASLIAGLIASLTAQLAVDSEGYKKDHELDNV